MNDSDDESKKYRAKSNQPSDASKEATKTAAKTAANAYAGPIGGKAVDALSNTKIGDAILTKGAKFLEKKPGGKQMANLAQKSGALDAINQMSDAKAGGGSGAAPTSSGTAPKSSMNLDDSGNSSLNPFNSKKNSSSEKTETDMETGEVDTSAKFYSFIGKHKITFLFPVIGLLLIILIILIIGAVVISPATTVIEFFRDAWDSMVTFVTDDESTQEWELKYYQTLDEVQEELNSKYGVCIDVNLITATLTVDVSNDKYINEGKDVVADDGSGDNGSELGLTGSDYKKMIKQVELLGNMQIKRTIYGLDEQVKRNNADSGISDDYCAEESTTYNFGEEGTIGREDDFKLDDYTGLASSLINTVNRLKLSATGTPIRSSLNSREIASNDLSPGIWTLLTKKANEERNIQYTFYVPAYSYEEVIDESTNTKVTKKVCYAQLPSDPYDFATLDIGSLNDMENNVYFWNLMDSFIADYYSDYLPKDISEYPSVGSEAYEKIKDIISDIYLLWNEMGTNQTCQSTKSYICRSDEGSEYYGGGETSLTRNEFIEKIAPTAIDDMSDTGVFASITIAQAAIESRNGKSKLSSQYSNYYGMTAGSCAPSSSASTSNGTVLQSGEDGNNCTGNAYWNGSVVAMCNSSGGDCQWYRIYDSFENSTKDHSRLVSNVYGCNQSTYKEYLSCIVKKGYSSSSSYEDTILKTISSYSLTDYDIGTYSGITTDDIEPQFVNNMCSSFGTASGDWANWKQYDDAWKDVTLGPSTVGKIGCAMTSVAIQIMRSGVSTTLGENFNPGTFAKALSNVGGFDKRGNINWSAVSNIASGFKWTGTRYSGSVSISDISTKINNGEYIILNVKNGRHWVAVDHVEGNKIYMYDPGSGGTEVGATYGLDSIVGYTTYKKG